MVTEPVVSDAGTPAGAVNEPVVKRVRMPAGTIVAVVAVGILIISQLAAGNFGQAVVGGIFFVFLLKAHPLAHQWARIVSMLLLASLVVSALFLAITPTAAGVDPAFPMAGSLAAAAVFLGISLLPGAIYVGLGRRSSLQYFGLVCPECGSYKVKAASFLFNRIRCKKCKLVWKLRERPARIAEVFE